MKLQEGGEKPHFKFRPFSIEPRIADKNIVNPTLQLHSSALLPAILLICYQCLILKSFVQPASDL